MRLSHFYLTALIPFSLAGCHSVVSAQTTPDAKGTNPPLKEPATSSAQANNGLAVSISSLQSSTVYSGSKSQQPRTLSSFSPDDPHIDVVLQNISPQPISIHQEWNSWGYFNLSLEISKINGKPLPKPIIVKREGGQWTRNFAEAQTIVPGESIVREVHFPPVNGKKLKAFIGGDGYYSHFPSKPNSYVVYTMRAVYQDAQSDRERDAPPAWTGKAASPLLDYVVG
jgi:hypothetical protein